MSGKSRTTRIISYALFYVVVLTLEVWAQTSVGGPSNAANEANAVATQVGQPGTADGLPTPLASSFMDQQSGLNLDDLIGIANQRSRELLAARQDLIIGQGRIVQAGLRPNPFISFDSTTDRSFASEGEGGYGVSYLHPFELGGKRSKRIEVARLQLEQARAAVAFRESQLNAEIGSQYAEALAAVENLGAVEQLLQLSTQTLQVTQVRLERGDVSGLDANLVRVEVNRLAVQQVQLENRTRAALLVLRASTGMDADQAFKLRGELQAPRVELTQGEAEQLALENRQDLKAARLAEEAAKTDVRLAKAQAVPDVTTSFGYRRETSVFGANALAKAFNPKALIPGAKLSEQNKLWSFGISVQLPLFNRNQGAIEEAAGRVAQARQNREFAELVVKRDVAVAFNRYQAARQAVDLFQTGILILGRENLQTIRTAYGLGAQPIFEVINEQRRLVESQNGYIDALKEEYLSFIEMERAIGKPLK
jgi:outer membrane protein, heavy metal efflux system